MSEVTLRLSEDIVALAAHHQVTLQPDSEALQALAARLGAQLLPKVIISIISSVPERLDHSHTPRSFEEVQAQFTHAEPDDENETLIGITVGSLQNAVLTAAIARQLIDVRLNAMMATFIESERRRKINGIGLSVVGAAFTAYVAERPETHPVAKIIAGTLGVSLSAVGVGLAVATNRTVAKRRRWAIARIPEDAAPPVRVIPVEEM